MAEYIRLNEACEINMGQSPDSNSYNENGEGLPFFQGNADFGDVYPKTRVWCSIPTKIVEPETLLISVRAPIGALNFAKERSCIGRGLAGISAKDNFKNRYIYFCLKKKKNELNDKGTGSTFKAIAKNALGETLVRKVSLSEQNHIIEVLNNVQGVIDNRKRVIAEFDALIKARFVEMFGDPLKNTMNWDQKCITDICNNIYGGGTPSKSHPEYFEGNIPWVSPKDMKSDMIYDSQDHITEEAVENSSAKLVPSGAVLMVIRSGILKHSLPVAIAMVDVTVNQDMKAFITNDDISSEYLMYYFKAIENDVLSGVRGVTADNIDFKDFQKRMVIVPPIDKQKDFSDFVAQVDKSKVVVQKSLDETQLLFNSLMQKYFG